MNAILHHVNVTVPKSLEDATKRFYAEVMGMQEVPKPEELRKRGGAWYQLGPVQLHLSIENLEGAPVSKRHVCYTVTDLAAAEERFRSFGVEIIPDDQPMPDWPRFYGRDPGGNKLEIAASDYTGETD